MARYDRGVAAVEARLDAFERELLVQRTYMDDLLRRAEDQADEGRAARGTLFHILDELRGGGGAATVD